MVDRELFINPKDACRAVHHRLSTFPISLGPTWEVNLDAVERAREELGITWPVTVEVHPSLFVWQLEGICATYISGKYLQIAKWKIPILYRDKKHRIHLYEGLSSEWASLALWHEMTHAHQVEEFPNPKAWFKAHHAARKRFAGMTYEDYFDFPGEAEAYANMIKHFDICPLTKELT